MTRGIAASSSLLSALRSSAHLCSRFCRRLGKPAAARSASSAARRSRRASSSTTTTAPVPTPNYSSSTVSRSRTTRWTPSRASSLDAGTAPPPSLALPHPHSRLVSRLTTALSPTLLISVTPAPFAATGRTLTPTSRAGAAARCKRLASTSP
eukprot:4073178-Pleurochrysis_carterae.AAC.3